MAEDRTTEEDMEGILRGTRKVLESPTLTAAFLGAALVAVLVSERLLD